MAQRTVHYILGQMLAAACGVEDTPRFLYGSLLPDAIVDKSDRDVSHFAFRGDDGTRYYDFNRFRSDYAERMNDPLILGYYMHLVEDNFYRSFYHKIYHFYFVGEEKVRAVHRDYHLLNPYLRRTYPIDRRLMIPDGFDAEPIARIAAFDAEQLLLDFETDMTETPEGDFTYFTPTMMDEFIAMCLPPCEKELHAVLRGGLLLRAEDFAWNNRGKR